MSNITGFIINLSIWPKLSLAIFISNLWVKATHIYTLAIMEKVMEYILSCVCVQGYLHLKKAVHLLYTYLTYLYEKLYWYKKIRSQLFDKDASFSLWCYFLMQLYLSWVWSRLKHGKFAIMKYAKFNVVTHQKNYSLSCNF